MGGFKKIGPKHKTGNRTKKEREQKEEKLKLLDNHVKKRFKERTGANLSDYSLDYMLTKMFQKDYVYVGMQTYNKHVCIVKTRNKKKGKNIVI